jgi:type IV secretory pathway VirB2 component (pilin)
MKLIQLHSAEQAITNLSAFISNHASSLNYVCTVAAFFLACAFPEFASAQSSGGTLAASATTALNYIKTGVYFILIVAVLGSAVAAAFGRMEWATVGRVLIGCVVAGMATEVVDGLSNLKSQ